MRGIAMTPKYQDSITRKLQERIARAGGNTFDQMHLNIMLTMNGIDAAHRFVSAVEAARTIAAGKMRQLNLPV